MSELKPRIVTAEEVKAVSALDPIYRAGAKILLEKGIWVIRNNPTERGDFI